MVAAGAGGGCGTYFVLKCHSTVRSGLFVDVISRPGIRLKIHKCGMYGYF